MKLNEFYAKYADMPLGKRGQLTPIYHRLNELEDIVRPYQIRIEKFLREAEEIFEEIKK